MERYENELYKRESEMGRLGPGLTRKKDSTSSNTGLRSSMAMAESRDTGGGSEDSEGERLSGESIEGGGMTLDENG